MIIKETKIELLAPAKDKECAFAAIDAGADAVYIGAEGFGARKKAGNSLEDLKEIVDYAHKFLVKIYVTVNTIFFDNELKDVEKLVWNLHEIGVDAIIFQDFSFFEMNLPPIPLHASTQCNNDTLEKIKFLKSMNVERAVLPREFSLAEIRNITQNVDIETEVFVHGALCVSYSGQCYFSNYIGGRSANRGECAQPCRKKYSVVDDKGSIIWKPQYLLSMKDNNMSAHLRELIAAGVTSLKIEGRLKDKDYVTNVVAFYRQEIDKISKSLKPSLGEVKSDFVPNVDKTFNRTYTDFYINGQRKCFINPKSPKFTGEKLGKVKSVKGRMLVIDTKIKLNTADKISYFGENGELTGTTVVKLSGNSVEVLNSDTIKTGTVLYRNFDAEFDKRLKNADFKRKIGVHYCVNNEKITMHSFSENSVEYEFKEHFETANNPQKAKENIIKQLSKLGETEFEADEIKVDSNFNLFIPVSKINEIRRELVEKITEKSKENYKFNKREPVLQNSNYPVEKLDYSFNISNNKAETFYKKCGCSICEQALECSGKKTNIALMTTKHCLRDFAGICLKKNKDNRALFLVDEYECKYPLVFDCQHCVMKILAADCSKS